MASGEREKAEGAAGLACAFFAAGMTMEPMIGTFASPSCPRSSLPSPTSTSAQRPASRVLAAAAGRGAPAALSLPLLLAAGRHARRAMSFSDEPGPKKVRQVRVEEGLRGEAMRARALAVRGDGSDAASLA